MDNPFKRPFISQGWASHRPGLARRWNETFKFLPHLLADVPDIVILSDHAFASLFWLFHTPIVDASALLFTDELLVYAQRAAEQTSAVYGLREAIEHLSRAILAQQHLMQPDGLTIALHRMRAQAYDTVGEFELARIDYEAALFEAKAIGDKHAVWENQFSFGFMWTARDMPTARLYLDQALQTARVMNDAVTLGHSLNRIGNWLLNMDQPQTALRNHQEALQLFAQLGDVSGLATTHDLLGITHMLRTDYLACMPHHAQAAQLFRELGNYHGLISTLVLSSNHGGNYQSDTAAFAQEDIHTAWGYGDEAIRLSRQIGWRFGEAMSNMFLASAMGVRGHSHVRLPVHNGQWISPSILMP